MTDHKELVERLRSVAHQACFGPWTDTKVAGLKAIEDAIRVIEAQAAEIAALREALTEIGAFDDKLANEYLASHGSYGGFDEPASVMIARAVLTHRATTLRPSDLNLLK